MIAFAFSECGLSVDQFFELSWYEWGLHVYRVTERRKREHSNWENNAILVREQIAAMYNTAGKGFKKFFEGKDFIKLSFDEAEKKVTDYKVMTPEEVEQKFGKYLIPPKNGE
jgi:hypothetical protein